MTEPKPYEQRLTINVPDVLGTLAAELANDVRADWVAVLGEQKQAINTGNARLDELLREKQIVERSRAKTVGYGMLVAAILSAAEVETDIDVYDRWWREEVQPRPSGLFRRAAMRFRSQTQGDTEEQPNPVLFSGWLVDTLTLTTQSRTTHVSRLVLAKTGITPGFLVVADEYNGRCVADKGHAIYTRPNSIGRGNNMDYLPMDDTGRLLQFVNRTFSPSIESPWEVVSTDPDVWRQYTEQAVESKTYDLLRSLLLKNGITLTNKPE